MMRFFGWTLLLVVAVSLSLIWSGFWVTGPFYVYFLHPSEALQVVQVESGQWVIGAIVGLLIFGNMVEANARASAQENVNFEEKRRIERETRQEEESRLQEREQAVAERERTIAEEIRRRVKEETAKAQQEAEQARQEAEQARQEAEETRRENNDIRMLAKQTKQENDRLKGKNRQLVNILERKKKKYGEISEEFQQNKV